jgi:hypothetical protein
VPQIASAVNTHPDTAKAIVELLAGLIGKADDELISALDVPEESAMKSIIAACDLVGTRGLDLLVVAARHNAIRIRMNAIAGLEKLGNKNLEVSRHILHQVSTQDPVPDARRVAQRAMRALGLRPDGNRR